MKKYLLAFGIAASLGLGGCASFTNPLTQTQVYQLENAYGVAQSAAVGYLALPRCAKGVTASATNICSQHDVIVKLHNADVIARAALTNAENFVRNNPTLDASSVISEAESALSTLQQIEATAGVS